MLHLRLTPKPPAHQYHYSLDTIVNQKIISTHTKNQSLHDIKGPGNKADSTGIGLCLITENDSYEALRLVGNTTPSNGVYTPRISRCDIGCDIGRTDLPQILVIRPGKSQLYRHTTRFFD